jgi:hypothetical protein
MKKCKHCEGSDSFWLWGARDKFIVAFKEVKELKFGSLVSCPECENIYSKTSYPAAKGTVQLTRVGKSELAGVEKWNAAKLTPTKEQLKVLKEIGATPPDAYTNGSDTISFPCKCILKNKKELDYCYVYFRMQPPLKSNLYGAKSYYLLNEVETILPSEFALSKEVRYATTRANELQMSFAPTVVLGPDKKKYYFNWTNEFIAFKDWVGSDIKLPKDYSYNYKKPPEGGIIPFDHDYHIVLGDWSSSLLKLRIQGE